MPRVNIQKNWSDYLSAVGSANHASLVLFGKAREDTQWEWLAFLEKEMKELKMEKLTTSLDTAFFYTLVEILDLDLLRAIGASTNTLNNLLPLAAATTVAPRTELRGAAPNFPAEWLTLCHELDLTDEVTFAFLRRVKALPEPTQAQAVDVLRALHTSYINFKGIFELVAATFLYYMPKDTPVTVAEWKALMKSSRDSVEQRADVWPPIFRFLGQSFFEREAEVRDEAVYWLAAFKITEDTFDNQFEGLFITVMVYLAFCDLGVVPENLLIKQFSNYVWLALNLNVPLSELLKDVLADAPLLPDYIRLSGSLAAGMYNSQSVLFYGENESKTLTLEQFLRKFVAFARGDDLNGYLQVKYVEEVIQVYELFPDNRQLLLDLLSLYLHLRECDLIDYRGLLTDDGVKRNDAPDWKKIIHQDITENDLESFRRYLSLLHRPLRARMEIIIALDTVPWRKEPYFSRALMLSNLYEEMYGHIYGSIIYFNQTDGQWEIHRWINDPWGLFLPINIPPK